MRCWNWNGSNRFNLYRVMAVLVLCGTPGAEALGEDAPEVAAVAASAVQVVLLQIDSYPESQEIRTVLLKQEGVYRVQVRSETPKLITLEVDYSGDPTRLTAALKASIGDRYSIQQKSLPSVVTEINVAK